MAETPRVPRSVDGEPITDDALLIGMGCYEGVSHINKFGSIVLAASDTVSDVWDGGGTYSFPTSALMTHVSQTTDQAAARGIDTVIQGLDANWEEVEQTVSLNASDTTTPVALATPLMRVNRHWIVPDILLTSVVRLHNAGETIDYTALQLDHNQTLNAIYSVPAGVTAYITGGYADYVPTATRNPDNVHFHVQVRQTAAGGGWRVAESFGVTPGESTFDRKFGVYAKVPEKSDIRVTVRPEAKDVHAHASFDLILITNDRRNP